MKTFTRIIAWSLMALGTFAATAQEVLNFGPNSFDGWTYTRSSEEVPLNTVNITRNKINLYNDNGVDYTLISPVIDNGQATTLNVALVLRNTNQGVSGYTPRLTSPTVELLNADDEVVASAFILITKEELSYNLNTTLDVPGGSLQGLRLRLAAWSADVNNAISVYSVKALAETTSQPLPGDVDGNGVVNGSDVTALYNYLLNGAVPAGVADVDGNNTINGSDVTALYNMLLR